MMASGLAQSHPLFDHCECRMVPTSEDLVLWSILGRNSPAGRHASPGAALHLGTPGQEAQDPMEIEGEGRPVSEFCK